MECGDLMISFLGTPLLIFNVLSAVLLSGNWCPSDSDVV